MQHPIMRLPWHSTKSLELVPLSLCDPGRLMLSNIELPAINPHDCKMNAMAEVYEKVNIALLFSGSYKLSMIKAVMIC